MKVLHVLSSNKYSGAENVACYIIKKTRDHSNAFNMFYASQDGPIRETLNKQNISFLPYKKNNPFSLWGLIKKIKPDVIHAHDYIASFFIGLIPSKAKKIFHIHKDDPTVHKKSLKSFLFNLACKKAFHIFWVSREGYDKYFYKKKIAEKSSILINVIDEADILKKSNENFTDVFHENIDAIYVGRLSEEKNPLRLMSILKKVINVINNFKLVIIGIGPLFSDMKKFIIDNRLEKNVFLLGFIENPFPLIKKSKMVLFSSIFEGTPMVALESMCLGKPIISTPVGIKSIVDYDYNGYIEGDNDEYSKRIIEICVNEDHYNELSNNSLKKFKIINNEEQYISIIFNKYYSKR